MITELETKWFDLSSKFLDDKKTLNCLWEEILKYYSGKSRYYHNLSHIKSMLIQAEDHKKELMDFDALLFAIWYHDIIYTSTKKDNEEKSAIFAEKRLKSLNFDQIRLKNVQNLIISTKKHQIIVEENSDNAYLLDFDLSILGTDWNTYQKYVQNIRKEYKIYPSFMYNPGRKKVLKHFLDRDYLYFTEYYRQRFEKKARENLKKEIESL